MLTQIEGKSHRVKLKILPALPNVNNFPLVLNQGDSTAEYLLQGEGLHLLKRVELVNG